MHRWLSTTALAGALLLVTPARAAEPVTNPLRGLQAPGLEVELLGRDACTMVSDACGGQEWAAKTEEVRPDATLLFLGGVFMHGIDVGGEWRKSCHPEWDRRFGKALTRRVGDLQSLGGTVWAVMVPYPLGVWDTPTIRGEVDCINASIRRAPEDVPGVQRLELWAYLCPGGACALESNGVTIRRDGAHYDIQGAAELARWVLTQVEAPADVAGLASCETPAAALRPSVASQAEREGRRR